MKTLTLHTHVFKWQTKFLRQLQHNLTYHTTAQIPLPVPICDAGHLSLLILGNERVRIAEFVFRLALTDPQHLLAEIVINKRGLECEVPGWIDGIAVVLRWLHRSLVDGQQVELGVVALVEKQFVI